MTDIFNDTLIFIQLFLVIGGIIVGIYFTILFLFTSVSLLYENMHIRKEPDKNYWVKHL